MGAGLAELVCSNSFRSDDPLHNAVGLLHEEMRRCGSLIMQAADSSKLPAGGALAVDREGFSGAVRSEEHTSELQSLMRISYAVFCLKNKTQTIQNTSDH